MKTLNIWALSLATMAALAACGGGGGVSETVSAPPTNSSVTVTQPPAAPVIAASITISGTAAQGAALVGATVNVKCAAGTGNATTGGDGKYTVTITGASLPCALKVAGTDGTTFHSLIAGSGTSGTFAANLSPLTELIVAKAAAGTPAILFSNFDSAAQTKISTAVLDTAVAALIATFQGVIDLNGVNPIKDTLVVGNSLDKKLDELKAVLTAARTTLAELTNAVAASGDTPTSVRTILKPAAASCKGLRSGAYVAIAPVENKLVAPAVGWIEIDAPTLRITFTAGAVSKSFTLNDDGGCAYTIPNDGTSSTKILVSSSGLSVARETSTAGVNIGQTWVSDIFIPVQEIPLSALEGKWNVLEYFRDPTNGIPAFSPSYGSWTVNSIGTITAGTYCNSSSVCAVSEAVGGAFTVNQSGGFDIGGSGPIEPPSRAFAFKAADGNLSMFLLYSNGRGMIVLTKELPIALPNVGQVSNTWDFSMSSDGLAYPLTDLYVTYIAVDAAASTATRLRASNSLVDIYRFNYPQTGLLSHATNSCTINGVPNACGGTIVMRLNGAGLGLYGSIAPANYFGFFIYKP
jgi:hypothetical protein